MLFHLYAFFLATSESNHVAQSPVQTSSRLSKTFQEIIHDSNALECLLQYLDSQDAGHLLRFWHDANSFQASTLTRLHSHSVCYQSSSGLSETETDSDISSHSQSEQTEMMFKSTCDSSDKVKVTGREAGSPASAPPMKSSVQTGRGSCDAGQALNSFDVSHHASTPQQSGVSDNPASILASVDGFSGLSTKGQSNTDSAMVSETKLASTNSSWNPAEPFQLNESKWAASGSRACGAYQSCNEQESSSSVSSVHREITPSPVHSLSSINSSSCSANKLTLHERLLKSKSNIYLYIYIYIIFIVCIKTASK